MLFFMADHLLLLSSVFTHMFLSIELILIHSLCSPSKAVTTRRMHQIKKHARPKNQQINTMTENVFLLFF